MFASAWIEMCQAPPPARDFLGTPARALTCGAFSRTKTLNFFFKKNWQWRKKGVYIYEKSQVFFLNEKKSRKSARRNWDEFLSFLLLFSPQFSRASFRNFFLLRAGFAMGINRLCSATFEQLLAFWATFCSASNLEQLLPSLATFEQQIGIKLIQTIKKVFYLEGFYWKWSKVRMFNW